jgi:DNA segregation ATPase FtsK/SpoIIIE, S-DNA-T family
MARRRTKQVRFQYELNGILLILIAIIGFGRYGLVGRFLSSTSIFLVGYFHQLLFLAIAIIGFYMVLKSNKPKFLNSKLISIYIITISILVLLTIGYLVKDNVIATDLFKHNFDNYKLSMDNFERSSGGGIIGSAFTFLLVKLFDVGGTKILMWVTMITSMVLLTGISIIDLIKNLIFKFKWDFKIDKHREEIAKKEEEYEQDKRIVISSVDEITNKKEDKEDHKEQMTLDNFNVKGYSYPPLALLGIAKNTNKTSSDEIKANSMLLERVLKDFDLEGKVVNYHIGPSVTQYEVEVKSGTKVSRIVNLNKEIALELAAKDVRIQAPIPGKKTIGIEIPNRVNAVVTIREVLERFPKSLIDNKLAVVLGKNLMGEPIFMEINNAPHLLVAGSTGSGKSVCINSIIVSLLMRSRPDEVKLVLIDPKKVELSMYNGVPHLLAPVVTDPRRASAVLQKIVTEMEHRYTLLDNAGVKNIGAYNFYIEKKNKFLPEADQVKKLPYIVIIVDELSDLMLVAAKEVEQSILRITQLARAAGIHLIVATQRPSTDVITGLIKSNLPSRIAFAVSSGIDSRTILDMNGAEKLLGRGDMLFLPSGASVPDRIQGTFISDDEIKSVIDFTVSQQKAKYDERLIGEEHETAPSDNAHDAYDEPLYNEIVEFILKEGKASASLLQRRYRLGYNRAARVIDMLEERGVIGPNNGSKPREVLMKLEEKD